MSHRTFLKRLRAATRLGRTKLVPLLAVVTALLAVTAVAFSVLALRFQNDVIEASRYNRTFDLSQAQAEALRLQLAVASQFVPHAPGSASDVALRYAIMKTRVSVLHGPGHYVHDVVGTHGKEIAALGQAVASIEPLIAEADKPDAAAKILSVLAPLNSDLARLASLSNAIAGDVVARNQEDLIRVFDAICVVIVGLVLFGLALLALMNQQTRKLDLAAKRDWLTGLPNRTALHAMAERLDPDQDHALIFLDLDNFKDVNDGHGHSGGDHILRETCNRLREAAGKEAFVARLGGDEFAILISGENAEARARDCAARLSSSLCSPICLDGGQVVVSVSLGVALHRQGQAFDLPSLLKDADVALYAAKGAGRSQHVILTPDLRKVSDFRRQLQHDLPLALVNEEFHLVFQPIVDLTNGRARGFEALLRWEHPRLGGISPQAFIPLAEETGDIVALGRWVIEEGCRVAHNWPQDIFLSLNVSAVQFADPELSRCVAASLKRWDIPPHRLTLEITESVLVRNDDAQRILEDLRQLGVRVSLDDFGTGYASMGYLRQYSFEKIKIDKSFVNDMAVGNNSFAIVSAICSLAVNLSAEVVAEGIETAEHLDLACASGCSLGQGYLFARPMQERDVLPFLKTNAGPAEIAEARVRRVARESLSRTAVSLAGGT
ncbi:bifunctional diguanylate cyclase/phosphodiesterase [Aurantimonas sp. VKM B-3413]|uniref:putative bifunctional diguanylate cyclase/phosphodiesterase n=1 Tax=Aurantimonas sp. VKM B-3413 TaxID=2779401 RepID=UPI001E42B5FC|nr:bifunctional diguanylate cyclase/phosphodiesterase [Aurantimonas sp. VKM B-3413]MCB8837580.1 bifunctional diguanylate cyclase/phosphodiesterase [Aurantimonas sp. VKM B-3413]